MNDIEKLVAATRREHDKTKPAAKFFVFTALFLNVVVPIVIVIVLAILFFK